MKILAGEYKTTIGEDYIISPHIGGGDININNKFKVDSLGNVTLPDNATISWGQVTGTENIATTSQVTSITNDTIRTTTVTAENLNVQNLNTVNSNGYVKAKTDNQYAALEVACVDDGAGIRIYNG